MQVPYFARHYRAVTYDGRGNGRSDRPGHGDAYSEWEYAADLLAVLDATGADRAVLVECSSGAERILILAAEHPERVSGAVFIGPWVSLGVRLEESAYRWFDEDLDDHEGWAKYNRHYWLRDYRGFLEFFFAQCFPEPHSSKAIEDCVRWGLETTPETLILTQNAPELDEATTLDLCARLRCPVLVIHGDEDRICLPAQGAALAEATGGRLVTLEGSGHCPQARDPVRVNLMIREFVESLERSA
jgi:pimeloyl-ACP methyl ester carboxylesterase